MCLEGKQALTPGVSEIMLQFSDKGDIHVRSQIEHLAQFDAAVPGISGAVRIQHFTQLGNLTPSITGDSCIDGNSGSMRHRKQFKRWRIINLLRPVDA